MPDLTDHDAERSVLGSILIDPGAMLPVSTLTEAKDFDDDRHAKIFEAMLSLYREQTPIDFVTLPDRLGPALSGVGGAAYLTEMINATPTAINVEHYARIVRRWATMRLLMETTGDVAKYVYSTQEHVDDVFAKIRQMYDRRQPMEESEAVLLWANSLDKFFVDQLKREQESIEISQGLANKRIGLPWRSVSKLIRVIRDATIMTIAADSGVGKTVMMECLAEHWARTGLNVVFFHLELNHQFMLDRRCARQSGEPMDIIEDGQTTKKMLQTNERLAKWPGGVHYVYCPGWSAYHVTQEARKLNARGLCDVAIIDYFQLLQLSLRKGQNVVNARGAALDGIKTCAGQLEIPFVIGSQFSNKTRDAKRKTASLMFGAAELEHKSNVCITLDRPILSNDLVMDGHVLAQAGNRGPNCRLRVDKHTGGNTGEVDIVMHASRYALLDQGQSVEDAIRTK